MDGHSLVVYERAHVNYTEIDVPHDKSAGESNEDPDLMGPPGKQLSSPVNNSGSRGG